jgi:hypothetical protein
MLAAMLLIQRDRRHQRYLDRELDARSRRNLSVRRCPVADGYASLCR